MDIRHLITFTTVVAAGTCLSAAKRLGCSQSTVTLHLQELERELGVRLFERTGRRLALTEAGRRLTMRCQQILDALDDLKREMQSMDEGATGQIRLGIVEPAASVMLPQVLASLRKHSPGLTVRVQVAGSDTITREVASGDLDIGVSANVECGTATTFEALFVEKLMLAIPRTDVLARKRSLRAADLQNRRVIVTERGCAYRRAVQDQLSRKGVTTQVAYEMGSIPAILQSAGAGLGIGIVPSSSIGRGVKNIVARPLTDCPLGVAIGAVQRVAIGEPSPAVGRLLTELRRAHAGRGAARHGGRAY